MSTAATVFLSIFGGGSLVTLITFLVKRHDDKKDKNSEVLKEVKDIKKDVHDFKEEVKQRFDQMDRKIDDGQAIQARARILRFSDELQNGHIFSKEAWNQTFEDMSMYAEHCDKYDDFKNKKADVAIKNVSKVHAELLARERQGETVFL